MKNSLKVALVSTILLSLPCSSVLAGYGSAPSPARAPVCGQSKPETPEFTFVKNSGADQIELGWNHVDRATSWTIAYGRQKGKYVYGMSDFGDSSSKSVTIGMLPAGSYYIVLRANHDCMPGAFSTERQIVVSGGGVVQTVYANEDNYVPEVVYVPSGTPAPTQSITPTPKVTVYPQPSPTVMEVQPKRSWLSNFFHNLVDFIFGK